MIYKTYKFKCIKLEKNILYDKENILLSLTIINYMRSLINILKSIIRFYEFLSGQTGVGSLVNGVVFGLIGFLVNRFSLNLSFVKTYQLIEPLIELYT